MFLAMSHNKSPLPPNSTTNQHFIAQKVQWLNAGPSLNGQISHIRKYRRVAEDRIRRTNGEGMPIRHNLAIFDLYTFDLDGRMRRNFETLFHRYEANVPQLTQTLLVKVRNGRGDIEEEISGILAAKFLDFARNPYSIRKCLNTFPQLSNHHPTDRDSYNTYRRIWDGKNPRQTRICNMLGVTEEEYRRWLVTLFMLLHQHDGTSTFLEQVITGLITNPNAYSCTHVFFFDDASVLLSDRSCNELDSSENMVMEFHACAQMYLTFSSLQIDAMKYPKEMLKIFKANRTPRLETVALRNQYPLLESYNRRAVFQCFEHVYGAATSFPGILIDD